MESGKLIRIAYSYLIKMLPGFSSTNVLCAFDRAADLSSSGGWANALCQQVLDFAGLYLGQFSHSVAFASRSKFGVKFRPVAISDGFQSGSQSVLSIFFARAVFKIRQAIVSRIPVKVIYDYVLWLWTKKGPSYETVYSDRGVSFSFAVENNTKIALDGQIRAAQSTLKRRFSRATANAAQTRSLVQAFKAGNCLPCFLLEFFLSESRIVVSHFISFADGLVRAVRGVSAPRRLVSL